MRTLNRTQNKTIIMVTHDPKAAEYASRQVHLDKGQLNGVADTRTAA
jgi:putative ABC transport system ATP-binding protein